MSQLVMYIVIFTLILVFLKLIVCELDGRRANKMYNLRYFLSFTQPFRYGRTRSMLFMAFLFFIIFIDFDITTLDGILYCILFLVISIVMDVISQIAYHYYGKNRFKVGINKALKVREELTAASLVDDFENVVLPEGSFDFIDLCEKSFYDDYHVAICSTDGGYFASQLKKIPYVTFLLDQFKLQAKERLADSPIKVTQLTESKGLPFKDGKLDEYIVNYCNFDKNDVLRVLKDNGTLIIRHKGSDEMKELVLNPYNPMMQTQWNLNVCRNILESNGFYVYESQEVNSLISFNSIQSLITYLRQNTPEQKINVDLYLNQLAFIHANIKQKGHFSLTKHEFYLIARKK